MNSRFPEPAEASRRTRRHLTILFADLSGYTALSESLDPDQSLNLLQSVKQVCERVVTCHGGVVHGSKGDGVMAIFGFPESIERAARSAIDAALDLSEAIRDVEIPFPAGRGAAPRLHTGVHAGLVTFEANDVSMIGGEAPNIAARLSDLAIDDQILVSAATLGGERHLFDVEDRGALQLQGRAQPLAILQILGRSAAGTRTEERSDSGRTPFVGRTNELERIGEALERVIRGGRAGVAIVAPAGAGKTRLVERFLQRAGERSVEIHRGCCGNYPGAKPLQPLLQMLRDLAPDHGPLVLFVDDWQHADDATRQALTAIRQARANMLVITASRELPLGTLGDDAEVVYLPPLSETEASTTILSLWPEANPLQVEDVQRRSGGNPLYIEELCHWALPEPITTERGRHDALPAWLSTLIESRVTRLPEPLATIVQAAAIIGPVVPTSLLEQATGHDIDGAMLAELALRDLLYRGEVNGTLRFKHGITRDVIYASIPPSVREQMHRSITGLLERPQG